MKKYDIEIKINKLNEFEARRMYDRLVEGKETILHPTTQMILKEKLEEVMEDSAGVPIMECNTRDCTNEDWQGTFMGNLCMPCYQYYSTELEQTSKFSRGHTNHIEECKSYLKECEIFIIEKKYK